MEGQSNLCNKFICMKEETYVFSKFIYIHISLNFCVHVYDIIIYYDTLMECVFDCIENTRITYTYS